MKRYDVIILGAGPAGAEAGRVAGDLSLKALVIDEARVAGGQVHRAPDSREGQTLRRQLSESKVDLAFEHRIWLAASGPTGFEVAAVGPNHPLVAQSDAVIVATGATERFYPRPGWTLPGVIGLGAATVMLKAHRLLPGRRVLVAGPGPLAPMVAALIRQGGGEVAGLVDPNPLGAWIRTLPRLVRRPDLLAQGAKWIAGLAAKGVPTILRGWDIRSIEGNPCVEAVTLGPVDDGWRPIDSHREIRFEVDAVCLGYGLAPATEFYRLLGADHEFLPERGGWVPRLDAAQRTSLQRLYGAGDGAALEGAAAAPLTGRLAALTAAFDLGRLKEVDYRRESERTSRKLARARQFGRAMARLVEPRASAMQAVQDDTIVCRCEDVTAQELRVAMRRGASELNALKSATRCGMGPCGGRMCAEAAAALMECAGLARTEIGQWNARPPLRPIPMAALTGRFDYDDIPIPEPAPL